MWSKGMREADGLSCEAQGVNSLEGQKIQSVGERPGTDWGKRKKKSFHGSCVLHFQINDLLYSFIPPLFQTHREILLKFPFNWGRDCRPESLLLFSQLGEPEFKAAFLTLKTEFFKVWNLDYFSSKILKSIWFLALFLSSSPVTMAALLASPFL